MEPTAAEIANVARALKGLRAAATRWAPAAGSGHTAARRWIVGLDDGRSVFVKGATDEATASWLRDEHVVYSLLRGSAFMPAYLGWYDDGSWPVLVLEDLSGASWPPPWEPWTIDAVRSCLAEVASTPPPAGLPTADDAHLGLREGWTEVERDPTPFLELGLCSAGWLARSLADLREASRTAPLAGGGLLHLDVRSDNVCLRADGRAALVDWNWASVGNPEIDTVFWLPSLHAEGGPPPEDVAPQASPGLVACWAGYLCSHAARDPIATAPGVRAAQLRQARSALPWAARRLGLPPPG